MSQQAAHNKVPRYNKVRMNVLCCARAERFVSPAPTLGMKEEADLGSLVPLVR